MTELGLQTISATKNATMYSILFLCKNYIMSNNNDIYNCFSIINHKNKKRKIGQNECKNICNYSNFCKNYQKKPRFYKLYPTKIDKKIQHIFLRPQELFPQCVIYNNRQFLQELSNKLAQKINLQIVRYRGAKKVTFVGFVAKNCANRAAKEEQFSLQKYLCKYIDNLQKKELAILPYLVLNCLLQKIVEANAVLVQYAAEIMAGSRTKNFSSAQKMSHAKIYGIQKYNKNSAKINVFSAINANFCVFLFIDKLNKLQAYINKLMTAILKISQNYCKF